MCKKDYNDDGESKLFDTTTKQWIYVNIKPTRQYFAVVYYMKTVWIIGGIECGGQNYICNEDGIPGRLNSIIVYDPVTKTQTLSPIKMIHARMGHRVIVYKKKLFVFGGHGEDAVPLNSVEMFSQETKKFVTMAPMKIARSNFACCRVGSLVFVVGGFVVGRWMGVTDRSVEVYNLDNNTWTGGVDFPVPDFGLCACAVNNKLLQ